MTREIKRFRTLLFSAVVGGALTFGTSTALRAAPSGAECPDWGDGRCTTTAGCQLRCDARYPGQGLTGICETGCCYCVE